MAVEPKGSSSLGDAILGGAFLKPLVDAILPDPRSMKLGVGPERVPVAVKAPSRDRSSGMDI